MGRRISEGSGDTKMAAEQIAAKKALVQTPPTA
jgi:hypothetical protein